VLPAQSTRCHMPAHPHSPPCKPEISRKKTSSSIPWHWSTSSIQYREFLVTKKHKASGYLPTGSLRNQKSNAVFSKTCMAGVTGFKKMQKQPRTSILTKHRTNFNLTGDQAPGVCAPLLHGEIESMVFFSYQGLGPFLASSDFELIMKLRTCGHLVDSSYGLY